MLQKVIFRMENGALAGAFDRWHSQYSLFKHQRFILEKIVMRIKNLACAAAVDQWRQTVDTLNHQRNVLERSWEQNVLLFIRQRTVLDRVIRRMVSEALSQWRDEGD